MKWRHATDRVDIHERKNTILDLVKLLSTISCDVTQLRYIFPFRIIGNSYDYFFVYLIWLPCANY